MILNRHATSILDRSDMKTDDTSPEFPIPSKGFPLVNPKVHLFTQSGTLFVTTETIPKHPEPILGLDEAYYKATQAYKTFIAAIKSRAVVVENAESLGDIKSMSGTETFPNVWRVGEFALPYFSDQYQFLPIECEVRYEERDSKKEWQWGMTEKVAVLSPVVSKEETQGEDQKNIWDHAHEDTFDYHWSIEEQNAVREVFKRLKSRFTITRKE